ncbi:MAG: right-handed parallel beta-helix repeat-containing protein [Micromonosporaceae bacterium]
MFGRHSLRALVISGLAGGLLLFGPAYGAVAHEERPAEFPDGSGTVPTYREYPAPHRLVVCRPDSKQRISQYTGAVRARNEALLAECEYSSIQDAVNAVSVAQSTIYVLPGVYNEAKWADQPPTPYCANLETSSDDPLTASQYIGTLSGPDAAPAAEEDGSQTVAISYADQLRCPHNLNLIAILGDRSPDDDSIECDSQWCGLQIEGTGRTPADVVIDNRFRKLNAIRADRADGVYFRNFTVQQAEFNSLYVLETDGFVAEHMIARANDEYGILAFASDHGLIQHVDGYYNGDSAIYPGSASDLNADNTDFTPVRYAVEIRDNHMHHNALGYSGTAGNSVYAHHNKIHHNGVGMATDSVFPGHPGLPQDHARFSHNDVWSNNVNYYENVFDGRCDKPMAERDYLGGVVCPVIAMPVGTGILIAGGNYNSVDHNRIYDNWRYGTMQFWVPAPIRDDYDPNHLYDTSHHNHYVGNTLGFAPDGTRHHNGLDFWWDDEGAGNCWEGNVSSYGLPTSNSTLPRPSCETGGSVFTPGMPVKDAGFVTCTQYNRADPVWRQPPGCEWLTTPERPGASRLTNAALPHSPVNGAGALLPGLLALASLITGYAIQRRHRRPARL